MRLTPAQERSAKRADSTDEGLASRVISTSGGNPQCRSAASINAATVAGGISEGVPPPKKSEVRRRPGVAAASYARSASNASRQLSWSTVSRTCELKSQEGHFETQNGQWM